MRQFCLATFLLVMCSGCLHVPLQKNFLQQSKTISEIEHQQVIDNLAKFMVNPASLPHFALPDSGTSQMTAQGSTGLDLNYTRVLFSSWKYTLGGNATEQENWVMKPVNDPGRLRRMQCAYQLAIGARDGEDLSGECSTCIASLKKVGLIEDSTRVENASGGTDEVPDPQKLMQSLCCNFPTCWYGVGCKKDVPENACYVGRYGHRYVWVLPHHMDEFTRFTLTILTLATTDPAPANAEVERTLDANQKVTGYKIKTRENVYFEKLKNSSDFTVDKVDETERAYLLDGPVAEPQRDRESPTSGLQGLLQLQSD